SRMRTVIPTAAPATDVEDDWAATQAAAAPGWTLTVALPRVPAWAVSTALRLPDPAVLSVTDTCFTPESEAAKVKLAGSTAVGSLLVRWTVPVYPVEVAPVASMAVTVRLNACPAVGLLLAGVSLRPATAGGLLLLQAARMQSAKEAKRTDRVMAHLRTS